jgi:NAD(P)-dependent dehydrogenase (short-subunit alcohol dehydrogenase family)
MSMPVAIVTGAGSGLGRATALALSTPELAVVAVGRRAERLRETAAPARGPVRVVAADVADAAARASITAALAPDEQVRFLVHCAGMHAIEPFAAITPDAWRQVMTTNVDARLFLTEQLLPWLAAGARVLFVGSNSATRARRSATAYCVSQAASFMLHECLKIELADRSIAVTSALPSRSPRPCSMRSSPPIRRSIRMPSSIGSSTPRANSSRRKPSRASTDGCSRRCRLRSIRPRRGTCGTRRTIPCGSAAAICTRSRTRNCGDSPVALLVLQVLACRLVAC